MAQSSGCIKLTRCPSCDLLGLRNEVPTANPGLPQAWGIREPGRPSQTPSRRLDAVQHGGWGDVARPRGSRLAGSSVPLSLVAEGPEARPSWWTPCGNYAPFMSQNQPWAQSSWGILHATCGKSGHWISVDLTHPRAQDQGLLRVGPARSGPHLPCASLRAPPTQHRAAGGQAGWPLR